MDGNLHVIAEEQRATSFRSPLCRQRCATAAIIIIAHIIILIMVSRAKRLPVARAPNISAFYMMDLAIQRKTQNQEVDAHARAPARLSIRTTEENAGSGASGAPAASPGTPSVNSEPIDWDLEAHRVAGDFVDEMVRKEPRKCLDSPEPGSWLPPCKKHFTNPAWSEHHKRCVVALLHAGCLEADGHLFDAMNDPDRDRSSVPDTSDINQPAAHHRSVVISSGAKLPEIHP
jgi:hypothetical protein